MAKPSRYYLKKFNYQLVDFLDLNASYSCFDFLQAVRKIIAHNSKSRIYLVGGSSLYQKVIMDGLSEMNEINPEIKKKLAEEHREGKMADLLKELKAKDPECYHSIDKKNPRRVLRALEVIRSGMLFSAVRKNRRGNELNVLKITLLPPRKKLYDNIDQTIEKMFQRNWLLEVNCLIEKMNVEQVYQIKAIGYREIADFILKKNLSLEQLKTKIKQKTRNYAKQQLTWFKKKLTGIIFHQSKQKKSTISDYDAKLDGWILKRYSINPTSFVFDSKELSDKIETFFTN